MTTNPNGLKYILDSLKRAADNSESWPVYPAESGLILAEIDRLRKENEELTLERAAVVAWLFRNSYDDTAARIERGEHRREEGKP